MWRGKTPESLEELHKRYQSFAREVIVALGIFFLATAATLVIQQLQGNDIESTANENKKLAIEQKEGRAFAVNFTCGSIDAVIAAGRKIVTGNGRMSPLEKALLKEFKINEKLVLDQRKKSANDYTQDIINTVEDKTGTVGLVQKNGKINCEKVLKQAKTGKVKKSTKKK